MSYQYRNKTDQKLMIPNVGEVEGKGTITSETKLENQHLEEVSAQPAQQRPVEPPAGETK